MCEEFEVFAEVERVDRAIRFVRLCNRHMGHVFVHGEGRAEQREIELHPAQEGAFRAALGCLNRYFGVTQCQERVTK